jgi:hypothetical protein
MNTLPQELIDRISSYLNRDDLRNTLLLSRKLQYAAEQYSGLFSDFALTSDNAAKFLSIYSSYRFRYLRNVSFATTVPAIDSNDDAEQDCRDTAKELKIVDEEFTRQISVLFSTLKMLESRVKDKYGPGRIHLTVYTPTRDLCAGQCYHRKFTSWRVHLLSPSTLPTLTSVQSLTLNASATDMAYPNEGGRFPRKLDHRVFLDLAIKCPNLKKLQCRLGGDEWLGSFESQAMNESCQDWLGPRRDSRHDFGKAYKGQEGVALPCLRHVQLDFLYPLHWVEDFDQRVALPNLVKPALSDLFSTSLRILSYHLRTMSLRVVADETLFWPLDSSCETPFWPNMEIISIMFHMSTPSGSWYFRGLPGIGATERFDVTTEDYPPLAPTERDSANDNDDEVEYVQWNTGNPFSRCQVRVYPDDETLVPFITAFARAAACMPSLKEFALWTPLKYDYWEDLGEYEHVDPSHVSQYAGEDKHPELAWGIAYVAPGEQDFTLWPKGDYSPNRRIWWRVANWRPSVALYDFFQRVGREKHGEGLLEYWNDEAIEYRNGQNNCGDGLGSRDWFTEWERIRWNIDPADF